jgi:predicted nucleotidyltransferase
VADRLIRLTRLFVERKLEPWPEFLAALVVGSVANGEGRPDSDVDCIFIFRRLDERVVPAEFVWQPETDKFFTIFDAEADQIGAVQIDAGSKRVALDEFLAADWEEDLKHELSQAIVLFDRDNSVMPRIAEKLHYPDEFRVERVAVLTTAIEQSLETWRLQSWITRGGLMCAHEQLSAAFEDVLKLLHAVNRAWLPWRYRWLISALKLPWLPVDFASRAQDAYRNGNLTDADLWRRQAILLQLLEDIRDYLKADASLALPANAFAQAHRDLGYAHNFEAWIVAHREFLREHGTVE